MNARAPNGAVEDRDGSPEHAPARVRLDRHARHLLLKEIGGSGQRRLAGATVALVGVGGLGAPAALYLAAAGVGRLILIDPDTVELSNLQRQVLFRSDDVGAGKAAAGGAHLRALDPEVRVETHARALDARNAEALLAGADLVLDGTDNFSTRFVVNAACHALGTPLVSGAVGRWDGQVSVFASGAVAGAPCYRCLVPEAPPEAETCAEEGVVGAMTGVIGTLMALEAIKLLAKAGEPLIGRVLVFDGLSGTSRTIALPADPACPVCGGGA
jgi:molybdopterin/thiamine biosynthesis adenylyltransferase